MSIDLEKAYFKKLEKYVGKKINIVSNENEIRIIYDVETSYVLQEEKEMETNFAIAIKGFFSEGIDYSGLEKIEGVVKLSDVNEIMKLHIGESYYSIMNPQKLKINLEEKGSNKYNIYLLGPNGECEYIEENEEAPFVFERFYNEAVYLKVILERVRGYEAIFEETLSEKEIYDIIK